MRVRKYNGNANFFFAVLLALSICSASGLSHAKTYLVPPYSATKKHPVTDNILKIVRELRTRGYGTQAKQLETLLNEKKIFYRTNHPNSNDFQYVHDQKFLTKDKNGLVVYRHIPEQLYISLSAAGYVTGKGPQRIDRKTFYSAVVSMLHELTHKDIGEDGQRSSEKHEAARGYQLHEIESYRRSLKWFVNTWVVGDLKDYLKKTKRSCDKKEDVDKLQDLLERAEIVHSATKGFGTIPTKAGKPYPYYGDKACRWKVAEKGAKKLRDILSAMKTDCESRYSCRANKVSGERYRQPSIEAGIKVKGLTDKFRKRSKRVNNLRRSYKRNARQLKLVTRKLNNERSQKRRLALAGQIAKLNAARKNLRTQLAEARRKLRSTRSQLNKAKTQQSAVRKRFLNGLKNYDQCRIDLVKRRLKSGAINRSQLPPDMVVDNNGNLTIVGKNKTRKLDLKAATEKIKDLFDYDVKLVGALDDAKPANDPRTPCYKAPKTKTASKNPPRKTHAKTRSWNPPAPPRTAAKPKKKCRRRGLVGAVNCVTERMDQ